jgi:hypothetical protein
MQQGHPARSIKKITAGKPEMVVYTNQKTGNQNSLWDENKIQVT